MKRGSGAAGCVEERVGACLPQAGAAQAKMLFLSAPGSAVVSLRCHQGLCSSSWPLEGCDSPL